MEKYLFDKYKRYPIHIILGDPGSGKSLVGTFLAFLAANDGISVFANWHLKNIPYHYIRYYEEFDEKGKPRMINDILRGYAEDGTKIEKGLLLWDEPQSSGINAHSFFSKETIEMAKWVSQIRKKDLALILLTQRFNFPVYNVRQLVAYVFEIHPTNTNGIVDVIRKDFNTDRLLDGGAMKLDLRHYFDYYNTKEMIGVKPDE